MLVLTQQMLLNSICDRVASRGSPLSVGWSVGLRNSLVDTLAGDFGFKSEEIDDMVEEMIGDGLLTIKASVPSFYSEQNKVHVAVTHQGWLNWSHMTPIYFRDLGFFDARAWIACEAHPLDESDCVEVFAKPSAVKQKIRSILDPWSPSQIEPRQ